MVRLGSLFAVVCLLGGCLEQELDVLSSVEAQRLLTAGSDKVWVTPDAGYQLELNQGTDSRFLLLDANGDSISYGTWSITEDVRGNFTDSLLFDLTVVDTSNPLSDVTTVKLLTSSLLDIQSEDRRLQFSFTQD
ncbi:MAG: hypothetical protein RIC80_06045 [Cyclobacteriaceae bacterium]